MVTIIKSVGEKGINSPSDVRKIQELINNNIYLLKNRAKLSIDGKVGKKTIAAIIAYQSKILKMLNPDGRIDPNGITLKKLNNTERKPRPGNVTVFIKKKLSDAKKIKAKYNIPISILIAQAALESGWGKNVKDNAYFGIKSHNTKNSITNFKTTEYINGKKISVTDSFRAYKNFSDAAEDYGKFLNTNSRYKKALSYSKDPYKFADKLQSAGYATDPRYAKKLKAIISTYYIDEYDK
jgi:flagellum-specific peptidoglycan hydrolase FlgJ